MEKIHNTLHSKSLTTRAIKCLANFELLVELQNMSCIWPVGMWNWREFPIKKEINRLFYYERMKPSRQKTQDLRCVDEFARAAFSTFNYFHFWNTTQAKVKLNERSRFHWGAAALLDPYRCLPLGHWAKHPSRKVHSLIWTTGGIFKKSHVI